MNNPSEVTINQAARPLTTGKKIHAGAVIALLFFAMLLRLVYAHGLPLNYDEALQLPVAQRISLGPDTFYLPYGNPGSPHPVGILYLMAFGDWIGGGSVFVVRFVFIALSLFGLCGLYLLCRTCLGDTAAMIALILASIDRYLVTMSSTLLGPASIFLVPWVLLAMIYCTRRGKVRDWLVLGLLCGLGWNCYQLFMLMPLIFFVYLLWCRKLLCVLKQCRPYFAAAVFAVSIIPHLLWNFTHGGPSISYVAEKSGQLGITPRFMMQYIGDLLICIKDSTWVIISGASEMYIPLHYPCHWAAGLTCLACSLYCLRYWRKEYFVLLLSAVLVPAVVVTVTAPHEPFNNFWWAGFTIIPAICLTASVFQNALHHIMTRVTLGVLVIGTSLSLFNFLAGPKWTYTCPQWEKHYIGKMFYYFRYAYGPKDKQQARKITRQAFRLHPDSAVVHYYRGLLSPSPSEQSEAFQRALDIDPYNPAVNLARADVFISQGKYAQAAEVLRETLAQGRDCFLLRRRLSEVEYHLGNYVEARKHARVAIAMRPGDIDSYKFLFMALDASGYTKLAQEALERFIAGYYEHTDEAYFDVAQSFLRHRRMGKALVFLEKALEINPDYVGACNNLAWILATIAEPALRDGPRAVELAQKCCVETGYGDPELLDTLAVAYAEAGRFREAVETARKAMAIAEDTGRNALAQQIGGHMTYFAASRPYYERP